MMPQKLYTKSFFLLFSYNFFMALNFTNNAIYPLYVKHSGGTAETVGAFMAAASLAAVTGRPLIGWMIDRWGTKPVFLLGSLGMALPSLGYWGLLGQGLVPAVWALRLLHGFGYGAHFSAFFTSAAESAPKGRRNEAIAMYGFSGLMANLIGPMLGEQVFDLYGLGPFFLMVTSFALVGATIVLMFKPFPRDSEVKPPAIGSALKLLGARPLWLVFALAFLLSACYSTPPAFLGPMAREREIARFGLYFTGYAVGGMGIRLLGRKWGDRFGLRRVLIPSFLVYATAMFTLFLAHSTGVVVLAGLLAGIAHGLAFPAVNALAYGLAPVGSGGSIIAMLTGMMDVSTMTTAYLFGVLAERFGYPAAFPAAASAGVLASLLVVISVLRKRAAIRWRGEQVPPIR
ncbi:MAG: MFS transporter [bacterium]